MNQESVIIPCPRCGAKNRVPRVRLQQVSKCGKCHALLAGGGDGNPIIVTDQTFEQEVIGFPGVVLVDCWATWCGACRAVGPVIDRIAENYAKRAKIAKLNVDENKTTASRYSIQSIPTLLFFKNGKLLNQLIGALPQEKIESQLQLLL